jgi:hypothetical protein
VLFDRFMIEEQFGWRVAENCPDALRYWIQKICLRLARQKLVRGRFFYLTDLFAEDVAKRKLPVYCVAIFL